jgi:hypothetical protein
LSLLGDLSDLVPLKVSEYFVKLKSIVCFEIDAMLSDSLVLKSHSGVEVLLLSKTFDLKWILDPCIFITANYGVKGLIAKIIK